MTARRQRGPAPGDGGSAAVEFLALGVLLLVPLAYLALLLGRVQAATFAVDAAAREASRAMVAAPDEAVGSARARTAVRLALLDQGFPVDPDAVTTVTCTGRPCLTPQERISVRVTVDVVLPGVPAFLDRVVPAHVTVASTQVASVDAFRPAAPP